VVLSAVLCKWPCLPADRQNPSSKMLPPPIRRSARRATLWSIPQAEAERSEVASVDPTEARSAPVRELFFLLLKTIVLARGGSPCGREATPRRSWVAVIRIKIGAGSKGNSYWIPTEACPHSLMRPQGPGESPGCDVGGATSGARRRPRYRRTRPRYLGILKSKYVSLIAPGPDLPGQPTGEQARGGRIQRRHSMPMIGARSTKSCQ
jgi:hypothetical protein